MLCLFFPLIALTGCASEETEKLPAYHLIFNATNNVNEQSPLKIRVFLLRSDSEFMSADFFLLQDNVQAVLGNNLVYSEFFILQPSQSQYSLLEKNVSGINAIGILAEYKQLDGRKWRISLPLASPEQPAFYKFWASAPDTLAICIQVTARGLNIINQCH